MRSADLSHFVICIQDVHARTHVQWVQPMDTATKQKERFIYMWRKGTREQPMDTKPKGYLVSS